MRRPAAERCSWPLSRADTAVARQIDGLALGAIAAGSLFTYAGIKGYSVPHALQALVKGQAPSTGGKANPIGSSAAAGTASSISGASSLSGGGNDAANQRLGQLMAGGYGWAPQQNPAEWNALNNIVEAESGWSDTVTNAGSGAAGIAQKISGWSPDYQQGNAPQQITWLLAYIKSRYGDPIAAWQFHLANGWY